MYKPGMMRGKTLRPFKPMGGSILLDVGAGGVGSSYDSVEEYKRVTGTGILGNKLRSLIVKPMIPNKKKSINFNL
jgi:hypothetical protein